MFLFISSTKGSIRPKTSSSSFSSSARSFSTIKNVTIFGSGLMGSGIAQVSAASGHHVTLVDVSDSFLNKAKGNIQESLTRVLKKAQPNETAANIEQSVNKTLANITLTTNPEKGVEKSDLVIEAIVENLDKKRELFTKLDKAAPQTTIFASNTSSIPIKLIAKGIRPDRFGGLHFFNPVPMMKLVEVVKTTETSQQTFDSLMSFGKAVGKEAVTCKDTPGFIVNRLLIPYMAEAIRMLERDDANFEDIDKAMKYGAGYPMGPFQLLDTVGLDTFKFILDGWHKDYPQEKLFFPSSLLNKMVEEGKFGRKVGKGFYDYTAQKKK